MGGDGWNGWKLKEYVLNNFINSYKFTNGLIMRFLNWYKFTTNYKLL